MSHQNSTELNIYRVQYKFYNSLLNSYTCIRYQLESAFLLLYIEESIRIKTLTYIHYY